MEKKSVLSSYKFLILLLCGMIAGCIVGAIWPGATCLAWIGNIFINLMLCIVVPLVFTSIFTAVATMKDPKRTGKIMGSSVGLFVLFGFIAAFIMIIICRNIPAATSVITDLEVSTDEVAQTTFGDMFANAVTVGDFADLLSRSNLLALIVFAVMLGVACNKTSGPEGKFVKLMKEVNDAVLKFVTIVTKFAPVAFFCIFANLIAIYGPQMIGSYGRSLLIYYPTVFIYCLVVFPLMAYIGGGKEGVKIMASKVLQPVMTAFGTCSSAATIPTNLRVAEESYIPKDVAEMVIPLGATMHMDGVVLSTIVKAALLFGVFGMDFAEIGIGKYVLLSCVAVFAAVGSAAVPRGGLIVESLICTLFFADKMAVAFPLILAFGELADPGSTMCNSAGDYVCCFIVARITDGKNWLKNALAKKSEEAVAAE